MLGDRQRMPAPGALGNDDVRQLLHAALRMRQGKAQSSLPEQLIAVFMQYYRQLDAPERLALFRGLTDGLGVQAAEVDAAAAAWQQLRQQQQQAGSGAPDADGHHQEHSGSNTSAPSSGAAPDLLFKAAERLAGAATPLYARLFVPISQQPGGIKFLVDLRAELLQAIREQPSGAVPLRALANSLRASLAEWFSVGLLQLRRIGWDGSSAALLEKARVAAGEAVHSFSGWADLKGRLGSSNRRVYAFFHEAMPGEPLVVLHTALMHSVPRSMPQVLPPSAAAAAAGAAGRLGTSPHDRHAGVTAAQAGPAERTWERMQRQGQPAQPVNQQLGEEGLQDPSVAAFYSISATQPGLAGVDLGNFLIKQVAHRVQAEFPSIRVLCTLSPLPGFADWLRLQLARSAQGLPPAATLLLPGEEADLEAAAAGHMPPAANATQQQEPQHGVDQQQKQEEEQQQQQQQGQESQQQSQQQLGEHRAGQLLSWALADDAWLHSTRLEAAVRAPLLRLAAHYLLRERRRGLALDPVANFHLRNGASVLQLNWGADLSPAGLRRSHGVMVNYLYELDRLQELNRAYLVDGRVAASQGVQALLAAQAGG
ncbi:hypothetical protein ABPG77_009406 [Micractinium sp. CCAP 211/92]